MPFQSISAFLLSVMSASGFSCTISSSSHVCTKLLTVSTVLSVKEKSVLPNKLAYFFWNILRRFSSRLRHCARGEIHALSLAMESLVQSINLSCSFGAYCNKSGRILLLPCHQNTRSVLWVCLVLRESLSMLSEFPICTDPDSLPCESFFGWDWTEQETASSDAHFH